MSTPATTERLAGLLDRHLSDSEFESGCRLSCGYDGEDRVAHIAAVLADAGVGFVAEAQAEALRDAADVAEDVERIGDTRSCDLTDDEKARYSRSPLSNLYEPSWGRELHERPRVIVAVWLRDRADRIGGPDA